MSPSDASVNGARRLPDGSLQDGRSGRRKEMEGVGGGRNGRRNMEGVGGGRKRPHSPTQPLRPGKNMCQLTCLAMTPNILWRGVMMLNFILQDVDKY